MRETINLFISTSSFAIKDICQCVNTLANLGIRNIEFSGGTDYSAYDEDRLLELKEQYELTVLMHNYFPPASKPFVLNIASNHEENRKRSISFCKKSIDLGIKMGIGQYSIHAGYATEYLPPNDESGSFVPVNSITKEEDFLIENMLNSLVDIGEYARKKGIYVGLENMFPHGQHKSKALLSTPERIFDFLIQTKSIQSGLLLDLGHLYIASNYFNFDKNRFIDDLLENYEDRVMGLHLSGNDGVNDLHRPLLVDDWQLHALKRFLYLGIPITLESRNLNNSILNKQINLIKSCMR